MRVDTPAPGDFGIPRKKNPLFGKREMDQPRVVERGIVGRVVTEDAEPAREPAEHRVGDKSRGRTGSGVHPQSVARDLISKKRAEPGSAQSFLTRFPLRCLFAYRPSGVTA